MQLHKEIEFKMNADKRQILESELASIHFLIRDVVIPKNGGGREVSHTDGFYKYTKLVNENIEAYRHLKSHKKRQFVIDKIINPLIEDDRRFFRYNKDDRCYDLVDLSNEKNVNAFAMCVVMQKIRDIMKQTDKKRRKKSCQSNQSNPKIKVMKKKQTKFDCDDNVFFDMGAFTPVPDEQMKINQLTDELVNDLLHDQIDDFSMKTASTETASIDDMEPVACDEFENDITTALLDTEGMYELSKILGAEDVGREKKNQNSETIKSQLSPLLNIVLSHPDIKYSHTVNLNIVKTKLENKGYDSISAVEQDLKYIFSDVQANERIQRDFLHLVTNYCRGIQQDR